MLIFVHLMSKVKIIPGMFWSLAFVWLLHLFGNGICLTLQWTLDVSQHLLHSCGEYIVQKYGRNSSTWHWVPSHILKKLLTFWFCNKLIFSVSANLIQGSQNGQVGYSPGFLLSNPVFWGNCNPYLYISKSSMSRGVEARAEMCEQ